ncbi:CPBP family intramembrane glutamic endopeptidase [Microbacterium sp. NPDC019599]|uniref:CPBP family intramembrane glutamic endopeptidase n=1 Tax=Microbacterium sp. NPDC019599 TaxID=3154690 RepID=UPI0033F07C90
MTEQATSGWRRFWNRGGGWKALLLAAVYYALYQLMSIFLVGPLFSSVWGEQGSAEYVFFAVTLPIVLAGVLLVVFGLSIGWLRELFGPQPIRGREWMWIAVVAVLLFNVLRFAAIDYAEAGFAVVASWLLAGLAIGFAEETLTRGYVVDLMRRAGHGEFAVALVSAGIFAALHAGNLLTGQDLVPTLLQLVYTFCFGICMYLTLRVTGSLIWPILLHASTDPSIFLLTLHPSQSPLTPIAGLGNFAVIGTGLVLMWFIRGKVAPTEPDGLPESATRRDVPRS